MSKTDKLLDKLLSRPKVYKWTDLVTLLESLGYRQIQGSGSRVKFDNGNPHSLILLHKPHPGNELKPKTISYIAEHLESQGHGK